MPNSNLTPAQIEAYAVARINDPSLDTLEITHPTAGTHYLVRNNEEVTAVLETGVEVEFEAVGFQITRPQQGENGAQFLTVSLDNTDRRISQFIEDIRFSQEETKIKFRTFLSSDLSQPSMVLPIELTATEIIMGVVDISIRARFMDVLNRPFPNENFTRARFPSLGD